MAQGLLVSVYRDADGYDCTNAGVSSRYKSFTLTAGDGVAPIEGPFEPESDERELVLTAGPFNTLRAVPRAIYDAGTWSNFQGMRYINAMFGGNFVYTSDSRFPSSAPIKVFDRVE